MAFLVLWCSLPVLSAYAQKEPVLPPELPPFGVEKPLQALVVQEVHLENGMTIWLAPRGGFPKVSFTLAVLGGTTADPKERPGLALLLGATIPEGTKQRNARQIAEEIQAAGGDTIAHASRDAIHISSSVLSSKAAEALKILADIAENASFPDDEVALAKRNLADHLDQQEADPAFLANRAMSKVLFENGPYSVTALTKECLSAVTSGELRTEFTRRFRPDHAVLVIVGDFKADEMRAAVLRQFEAWRAPLMPAITFPEVVAGKTRHAIFVVPRSESVQTTLSFGGIGPLRGSKDYEATEVANAIYGGTFGSRLTSNLREDKGYTYAPQSFLQVYRAAGALRTQADVRNAVTGASLNEILYEMNRMASSSPSERELKQAKHFLVGLEGLRLQSQEAVAAELTDLWTKALPPDEIGSYAERVSAVTAADVERVSREYFPASRMAIVAVGDERVIQDSLSTFGLAIGLVP